ncbi:T9SS type A sorting domain-containing protein [Xylanibacter muris]|uniref:T9SS type A sorting domain-containing protein n=2 Tax=Xylanibacter muris TaxID=2736290 RepID=A0ABX2AQS4_9BACT|nr:T9SS type A sorting domain-containing protein [Xylanibacter muris]NPD92897.1 T9SS type A sorting domain-containing protein [Xylanibacter muris]
MSKSTKLSLALLLGLGFNSGFAQNTPVSQMEKLNRGVVSVPAKSGTGRFVSWRMLGTDDENTKFEILRNGLSIKKDISEPTCYVDNKGSVSSEYKIVTWHDGVAADTSEVAKSWNNIYLSLPLDRPAGGKTNDGEYTYSPNDCSVGDVDGDGEYEIILKWDPSNSKDNSHEGYTGNVIFDCYKLDGTKLWRIDLGKNIRAGAHYTQFMVYDFDGDGRAEMICKTAPGSKDGKGYYVNQAATDPEIKSASNTIDWRNTSGKIRGGQEYLTVFNGFTGEAVHTIFYNPNRATTYGGAPSWTFNWDDRSGKTDKEYGNRGERYLATVAHLDGPAKRPSAVMCRGYYTYAFLWAVDFDGNQLRQKWFHSSKSKKQYSVTDINGETKEYTALPPTGNTSGSGTAYGNGNHNISVGDVNGDGRDEIIWGSCAIDHDGKMLYATGYGHGDAIHMSDLVPSNPGLEVFQVHEGAPYGWDIHDAATGMILHSSEGSGDNGRGLAADVIPSTKGFEFWSSNHREMRSCETGRQVSDSKPSVNFRIYWNGTLFDEILDGNKMDEWNGSGFSRVYPAGGKNFYEIASSSTCNGTKNTPNLQADILGDWREELILWDGSDAAHLNIFTTNVPTEFGVPTLMHDHVYRMGVAWQNVAYNQPPHLGYSLPDRFKIQYPKLTDGEFEQSVSLGDTIADIKRAWKYSSAPSLVKYTAPDGTSNVGKFNEWEGFKFKVMSLGTNKYFELKGKPEKMGTYEFVIRSGKSVVDNTERTDTIRIKVLDPSGIENVADMAEPWAVIAGDAIGGSVNVKLNMKSSQTVRLAVYDAAGAQVFGRTYKAPAGGSIMAGGLDRLPAGIYLVKVVSSEGTVVKKITKE